MPFRRRKPSQRGKHSVKARDPFEHLAEEREEAEASAWFLEPDDGPELDVQAGISSNLQQDDLELGDPGGSDDRWSEDRPVDQGR